MQSDESGGAYYLEVYFNGVDANQLSGIMEYSVVAVGSIPENTTITLADYGDNLANLTYTSSAITL
jgi:hypothetical protein